MIPSVVLSQEISSWKAFRVLSKKKMAGFCVNRCHPCDWSQTTTSGWRINLQADIADFNTGTCATKVDADRTASGLPAVCSKYVGKTNYEVLVLENKWNDYEMWAHAFSRAQATATNPPYIVRVFDRFFNIKTYMQNLHTTGGNPS